MSILNHLNKYLIEQVTLHEFIAMNLLAYFSLLYQNSLVFQKGNVSIVIKERERSTAHCGFLYLKKGKFRKIICFECILQLFEHSHKLCTK